MKKEREERVIYYSDELHDDFAGTNITEKPVPDDYVYLNKGLWRNLARALLYYIIVRPVAFFYIKLVKRVKFVGKKKFKGYKRGGAFIYGNHTALVLDAFDPSYLSFPRPADIVASPEATSIKGLGWLLKELGTLPVPNGGFHKMVKFQNALQEAYKKKHWIAIYPEAHIWKYYTGIRNFPPASFTYPVKAGAPCFSYTMVYLKRRHGDRPKRVVYIDGPFLPDTSLTVKEAAKKLRDEVYAAMCERAKLNTCEYIRYVYRPPEEEKE